MKYRNIALGTIAWTSFVLLSSSPSFSQNNNLTNSDVKANTIQKKDKKSHKQTLDRKVSDKTDDNSGNKLDPVVIRTRGDSVLNTPTVLTDRVTAKDITEKQVDDVHDISRLDPSINYNSANNSFNIRGLDADRVLTTIDGIPMPWVNDGARGIKAGVTNFDFSTLSTLDIVRGADSSLYGSGALGGVVMLRTLDPEDLITDEKNWGALTKGSYDTTDKSWHIDQAIAMRANQTYALLQAGYVTGRQRANNAEGPGGYGPKRGLSDPADYDLNNFLFKLYQHIDGSNRIGFAAERFNYDDDIRAYDSSTSIYVPGMVTNKNHRRRERVSMSYDYSGGGFLDAANAVVYWQKQDLEERSDAYRRSTPKGAFMRNNAMHETNYGITGKGFKVLDFGNVRHTIKFSGELAQNKFNQYSAGEDNCPLPPFSPAFSNCGSLLTNQADSPSVESNSFGFALEDEIAFLNNSLRITPGGRFDWYEHMPQKTAAYERNENFTGYAPANRKSRFSPKIRAEWDALDKVTLYAQWAQAFRAPSATELYLNYAHHAIMLQTGNPYLNPETSNGYDIGALLGDDHLGGSISLFTNEYKDFIDNIHVNDTSEFQYGVYRYVNRAHVRISGVEVKGHWLLDNGWHTNAAMSYIEGKDTDTEEFLNSIPPLKGVIGVGYAQENWGSDLTLTAVARRNKVSEGSDYAKAPGYTLVDLTAWYEPFGQKGPRLQAGIYNLFDKRYWNAVDLPSSSSAFKDYLSEPGRSFKVSFVQKF